MKDAEQIAEIAQSEHIWNLFVRSKLFRHAVRDAGALAEARNILQGQLIRFAEGHPERDRKRKAMERLKLRGSLSARKDFAES